MISFSPSDIYAIGVGKLDVDWRELNELGSKKDGERHAFILQDTEALYQVFEHMLGEELCPLQSDMGGMEPARGPGWEPAHSAAHTSVPTPTDVSQLTHTICGVGNMSANASVQERTPWHVTIKVPGRREGAWTQRWKRPGSRDIAVPEYHLFSCSLRARRPAGGLSSQTSGS